MKYLIGLTMVIISAALGVMGATGKLEFLPEWLGITACIFMFGLLIAGMLIALRSGKSAKDKI